MTWRRPLRRRWRVLGGAVGAVTLVGGLATWALWYVAGQLLTPVDRLPMRTEVLASTAEDVTLPRTEASTQPGTYGLEWEDGTAGVLRSAVLGEVTSTTGSTVTRTLLEGAPPTPGARARVLVTVWTVDPSRRGLDVTSVEVPTPLGPMPAWLVPAEGSTWVIQVHGLGAGRSAGLRTMPALHALDLPVLAITYRNDPGAPSDEDGTRHLGDTEWHDLDAAVRYAVQHGAQHVVLYGFSMGGAVVETYLDRGADTSAVSAVVLDSPVLDYRATIDHVVDRLGLPGVVGAIEERVVSLRTGVDLGTVDALAANRRAGGPRQPVLVFHGTDDAITPLASSRQLADEWPGTVTLVAVDDAPHTGSWNVDPPGYEDHLRRFLTGATG